MPRKRTARAQDVAAEFTDGLRRYGLALLSKGAPAAIKQRISQIQEELGVWHRVLGLLENSPQEIEALLTVDPNEVASNCDRLGIREEDLKTLRGLFDDLARSVSNAPISSDGAQPMYELMSRVAEPKPWAPKRFAPHFEEGFRRRENEGAPLAALAQQLIPDNCRLNLESAVQNMSRGIGRVRREHERCRKLGLPSPFLKN